MELIEQNKELGKFLYITLANCQKETEILLVGIEKIINKGADINYIDPITGNTLLMISVENGLYHTFCLLLKYQANIEIQNKEKKTVCHKAAVKEDSRFLRKLIKVNININSLDKLSNTPINEAIRCCKLNNIKILIEHGATLNLLNLFGDSIYDLAYETGNDEIINYLINLDEEKDKKDNIFGIFKRILHK